MAKDFDSSLAGLENSLSAKRRSAAKSLRKLGDKRACSHLLKALEQEIKDVRTWETQYQMVMALAYCGCRDVLPILEGFVGKLTAEPMVFDAIGHAIVMLGSKSNSDPSRILEIMKSDNDGYISGAFCAMAMMKMCFDQSTTEQIISFAETYQPADVPEWANTIPEWTAIAATGWQGQNVTRFLEKCLGSSNQQTIRAAEHALKGKYFKLTPL